MEFSAHWKQLEIAMENFKFKEEKSERGGDNTVTENKTPSLSFGGDNPTSDYPPTYKNIPDAPPSPGARFPSSIPGGKERMSILERNVEELQRSFLAGGTVQKLEVEVMEMQVGELCEEIKVLKETFFNKISEMQKDLLAMVEHCVDFEKVLSQTKQENQEMQSRIKELEEEKERRTQREQKVEKKLSLNKDAQRKKSSVEEVVSSKTTDDVGSNGCRIVNAVSSGSLGSSPGPSPSKSPPSILGRQKVMTLSPRSSTIMWHRPPSAPLYMPGYPQGYGAQDQFYPQFPQAPPGTVPDQYHYPAPFYTYGQETEGYQQHPDLLNYYNPQ